MEYLRQEIEKIEASIDSYDEVDTFVMQNSISAITEAGYHLETVEPLLQLLERHPVAYFGDPGEIVQFIEQFGGEYEPYLMASLKRTVGIGIQSFEKVRKSNCFYIDKTSFIKEWWENEDEVTLVTRPRRFGKTLNLNMLEVFFSQEYTGSGGLFEGLSIWEVLEAKGIPGEKIRQYGFAFQGKKVLIGERGDYDQSR